MSSSLSIKGCTRAESTVWGPVKARFLADGVSPSKQDALFPILQKGRKAFSGLRCWLSFATLCQLLASPKAALRVLGRVSRSVGIMARELMKKPTIKRWTSLFLNFPVLELLVRKSHCSVSSCKRLGAESHEEDCLDPLSRGKAAENHSISIGHARLRDPAPKNVMVTPSKRRLCREDYGINLKHFFCQG